MATGPSVPVTEKSTSPDEKMTGLDLKKIFLLQTLWQAKTNIAIIHLFFKSQVYYSFFSFISNC